jgi:hypothetical protein
VVAVSFQRHIADGVCGFWKLVIIKSKEAIIVGPTAFATSNVVNLHGCHSHGRVLLMKVLTVTHGASEQVKSIQAAFCSAVTGPAGH